MTAEKLAQIDRAEELIRGLGLSRQVRVRHHDTIARIDTDRLNAQFGGELYPIYLDLVAESIDPGGLETVLPPSPEPTSSPHFLYTLQWWSFALIASVGWVLYLRKQFFST